MRHRTLSSARHPSAAAAAPLPPKTQPRHWTAGNRRRGPRCLFATVSRRGSRWYVSLNVQAPDVHIQRRHPLRPADDQWRVRRGRPRPGRVRSRGHRGRDRGRPLARQPSHCSMASWACGDGPAPSLAASPAHCNRAKAIRRLSRQHAQIADTRRSFLHAVSSAARQDPRPALPGRPRRRQPHPQQAPCPRHRRRRLGRACPPARLQGGLVRDQVVVCDRWFPSTKTCSGCGLVTSNRWG